jgi:excisionase family DNA binding protein
MELLTIDDTADVLKVSASSVRRFIADGRLPAVKVGKSVRVRREAVEQMAQPAHLKARRERRRPRPMTADDPMSKLVGSVTDAPPTDSSKKYEYLADAIAPRQR